MPGGFLQSGAGQAESGWTTMTIEDSERSNLRRGRESVPEGQAEETGKTGAEVHGLWPSG